MEDANIIINGATADDYGQTAENFYDFDRENETTTAKVSDLVRKIEALEQEKLELIRENEEIKNRIKKSTAEIEGLKSAEAKTKETLREMEIAIENSESDKKVLEAVAARAAGLETEVSRLQHDLVSAMTEGDEANAEVRELKRILEEKALNIQSLERENETLNQRLEREVEEVKKAKTASESKVRELEKKIEVMEERESERNSKKDMVEEEKKREIRGLKKGMEELESVVAKKALELEKLIKEKKEVEVLKHSVEEALRFSEEKVKEMESKMIQLQKEVGEAEKVISGLKDKTVEVINGVATSAKKSVFGDDEVNRLNLQWPVVAAASGTIVAAAIVCYLQYGRRR